MRKPRRSLLAGCTALVAVAGAGPREPAPASAPAPLIATSFEGQVEVHDGVASAPVLVSTATEEVVVAPEAMARALRRLPGRTVTLHGWVLDAPQDALVMVVTRYEVAAPRLAAGTRRAGPTTPGGIDE